MHFMILIWYNTQTYFRKTEFYESDDRIDSLFLIFHVMYAEDLTFMCENPLRSCATCDRQSQNDRYLTR